MSKSVALYLKDKHVNTILIKDEDIETLLPLLIKDGTCDRYYEVKSDLLTFNIKTLTPHESVHLIPSDFPLFDLVNPPVEMTPWEGRGTLTQNGPFDFTYQAPDEETHDIFSYHVFDEAKKIMILAVNFVFDVKKEDA